MEQVDRIELRGVRQNNIKNIDLDIPLAKAIVLTGPSGSGKSSLAFETVYAEGQRRYMQSLSTYARQFLEHFRAPDVESIKNIPPTIALEQVNPVRNARATVGTTTELYDYLRLFFEKLGVEYCQQCDLPMQRHDAGEQAKTILSTRTGATVYIGFTKPMPDDSDNYRQSISELLAAGHTRVFLGAKVVPTESVLNSNARHRELTFITDRLLVPTEPRVVDQTRLVESIKSALSLGAGEACLIFECKDAKPVTQTITTQDSCPKCGAQSLPKSAISFSFNSPLGACTECKGFGNVLEVDPALVIPNSRLSIEQGAIEPLTKPSLTHWQKRLREFCKLQRIDTSIAYNELPSEQQQLIWDGGGKFAGISGVFQSLQKEKYKMRVRVFVARYTSAFTCPACHGARLNSAALRVKVRGKSIADLCELDLENLKLFFDSLDLNKRETTIVQDLKRQLDRRLDYLIAVGLGYLTLSRLSRSLSGGEYQRILLATQLSQLLTETLYVLDEPSIGLHPKDTQRLLEVMSRLKAHGNTLLIVEHDPEIIEWAEYVIDMGPGSGSLGGEVLFDGLHKAFLQADTLTAKSLKQWRKQCAESVPRPISPNHRTWLELFGACSNNLKNIDVRIPLNCLVSVTGVSGSGKSTLVVDTIYQALTKIFTGRSDRIGRFGSIRGFESLSGVELVDQSAIGKSSRSNPITFIKGYDEIRQIFGSVPDAVIRGLSPSHFSFNVPAGRCERCEGEGSVRIDMVFMEDVFVPCEVCDGKRFKPHVLAVKYQGKTIDDVLKMTVDDALSFFKDSKPLRAKLSVLQDVGLGYLPLGQPGTTLSGGEAQRLKIARELTAGIASQKPTLFILDEPTTGLHFSEIARLLNVFRRLLSLGHSIITIEHNAQIMCASHYLIDLGTDGGANGGTVIAFGSPLEVAHTNLPHTGKYLSEILDI